MEYPFIIGTAGHIDHGKTTLVKAMTGIDCDRLEEEKRRGITIELGFAPMRLSGGRTVSIVDVPGHERFIRQMAAGASGVDAAVLVIAANEGLMPQTREHLDILNLLGVRCGLVALTKKDLVDEDILEMAKAEAAELIQGSCLSGAAIIAASALTGEGIPEIIAEIENIISRIAPRKEFGAFFLPVDRVFSKKGFGSVVTGTAYQGAVSEGEEVELMPAGLTAKVRFLQAHGEKVSSVRAGQRAAINLSSIHQEDIIRGDVVCAKGIFIPTKCISAWVKVLPSARGALNHWQRVRLHAGTVDAAARISLMRLDTGERNRGYLPGEGGPVQILPESKICVTAGQSFVIRFYSPLVTIGGGRVMLPNASLARNRTDRRLKAEMLDCLNSSFNPVSFLAALISDKGLISIQNLSLLSQMEKNSFTKHLDELLTEPETRGLLEFGKSRIFISKAAFDLLALSIEKILKKFHEEHPELAGMEGDKLYPSLESLKLGAITHGVNSGEKISVLDFKDLTGIMAAKGIIVQAEIQGRTLYRALDFRPSPDNKFMTIVNSAKAAIDSAGFNLLTEKELEEKTKQSSQDIKRVLAYLREQDDLRTIKDGFLFPRELRYRLLTVLEEMKEDITVASLRDKLGVSRKYTMPMLEFLDSIGLTKREGDKRVLNGISDNKQPNGA